jgi:ribosomal protein S18 acetylase RimI-like enzyme
MLIRPASLSDLPGIVSADPYAENSVERREELRMWLHEKAVWIAEEKATVLGFIVVNRSFFGQSFVHLICVSPHMRRKGLAKSLVSHVESLHSSQKLFTSTNASNRGAQKLFERMGFIRSGVIENLDGGDPEYVYFKPQTRSADA